MLWHYPNRTYPKSFIFIIENKVIIFTQRMFYDCQITISFIRTYLSNTQLLFYTFITPSTRQNYLERLFCRELDKVCRGFDLIKSFEENIAALTTFDQSLGFQINYLFSPYLMLCSQDNKNAILFSNPLVNNRNDVTLEITSCRLQTFCCFQTVHSKGKSVPSFVVSFFLIHLLLI